MPHEKEKKRERGMQFRVALRMLILPVLDHYLSHISELPKARNQIVTTQTEFRHSAKIVYYRILSNTTNEKL